MSGTEGFAFALVFYFVEAFGGGPISVTIEAQTLDSCRRAQKVVVRELANTGAKKYTMVGCALSAEVSQKVMELTK
mgnify:CR=1 FL=1